MNHHATAIEWQKKGILFVGPPGSGKSELAYQLMKLGALLVADDQVILTQKNNHWIATCPPSIKNKIHLHEIGILEVKAADFSIIEIIFQSDLPAFPLSRPPLLNLPVIVIDFMAENAAEQVMEHLRGLTGHAP